MSISDLPVPLTQPDKVMDHEKGGGVEPPNIVLAKDIAVFRTDLPGVIAILGELGPGAVILEDGLAQLFNRHATSVKRAVQRGELPPPIRLFGKNAWTVGAIVRHFEDRLNQAAKERDRMMRRLDRLRP